MTIQKAAGMASVGCAATYLFGFAFLVTVLAPMGFGTNAIEAPAVVAFTQANPGFLILWNSVIYIVNALALLVLVVGLHDRLRTNTPAMAEVTRAVGLVWATLVLGAGMLANVAVERVAFVAQTDPARAANLWEILHAVELGLGGGNEIAGGVWIGGVSLAGALGRSLGKVTIALGLATGAGGLLTMIPSLGDAAGAVFGLGAIAWFIAVGVDLIRTRGNQSAQLRGQ